MNDSATSFETDEPALYNKEASYSQEKLQYKQKLIDKKNSGRIIPVAEKSDLVIQKIKSNEENK